MGKIREISCSPELMDMQQHFIEEATYREDLYFNVYQNMDSSIAGRYVCSDLFKETFPEYSKSLENRQLYSAIIHNSCAVMAEHYFKKLVSQPNIKKCIFLSGIPGAGKSFFVQSVALANGFDEDTMIYEGDIGTPTIKEKLDLVKNSGKEIYIIIINPTLRLAQENAIRRSFEFGRGASCETMARIASKVPSALDEIVKEYDATYSIYNKTSNYDITQSDNIEDLFKGSYDDILQNLQSLREEILPGIKEEFEKKTLIEEEGQEIERTKRFS